MKRSAIATAPTATTRTVPTAEMYDGDFRNWVNAAGADDSRSTIRPRRSRPPDGTVTRQVFPNNQIPKSLFDPTVVKALAAFRAGPTPLPNNGAAPGTFNYVQNNYLVTQGTEIRPNTKISVKGDHVLQREEPHLRLLGLQPVEPEVPGAYGPADLPGFFVNYNDTTRNSDVFRGSWDYAFSPTIF